MFMHRNAVAKSNQEQSRVNKISCSVREIIDVLPSFNHNSSGVTSVQFIERVEELKDAYQWNDGMVLFAIRSKLLGVAKLWVDAQPMFKTWQDFVIALIEDFSCMQNGADIHTYIFK